MNTCGRESPAAAGRKRCNLRLCEGRVQGPIDCTGYGEWVEGARRVRARPGGGAPRTAAIRGKAPGWLGELRQIHSMGVEPNCLTSELATRARPTCLSCRGGGAAHAFGRSDVTKGGGPVPILALKEESIPPSLPRRQPAGRADLRRTQRQQLPRFDPPAALEDLPDPIAKRRCLAAPRHHLHQTTDHRRVAQPKPRLRRDGRTGTRLRRGCPHKPCQAGDDESENNRVTQRPQPTSAGTSSSRTSTSARMRSIWAGSTMPAPKCSVDSAPQATP
jgi:hypothetical protein